MKHIPALTSPWQEAENKTLLLASLKLLLFLLLMSYCASKIVLLMQDSSYYGGKREFLTIWGWISVFALGMILDASWVLGKKQQSAERKGPIGVLLKVFLLTLSPLQSLRLVTVLAAAGLLVTGISFLTVVF